MRGPVVTSTLTVVFASLLLGAPVQAHAAAPVHPVKATVRRVVVDISHLDRAGGGSPGSPTSAVFSQVGGVWDAGGLGVGEQLQFRAHTGGRWSAWQSLEPQDTAADVSSVDARTAAARSAQHVASPVWVGPSDAVQARVIEAGGPQGPVVTASRHVSLVLVDPGRSAADANPAGTPTAGSSASASEAQPAIMTRAQWGADESLRNVNGPACSQPRYSSGIKAGFVHHTDGTNDYTQADVPAIIRGIYAYHVQTQGWCDIGYNYLVDRFGQVWEGRYGGITKAVLGAHTGGFNASTFGVSMIGSFTSVAPPPAMLNGLEHLLAWKLGLSYLDPLAQTSLVSAGGPDTSYAAGTTVTVKDISGHRDVDLTTCPGQAAYDQLGSIRAAVRADMGAALTSPTLSANSVPVGGAGPTLSAGVLESQTWQVVLRRLSDGLALRTWTGTATSSISVPVDLHDAAGLPMAAGAYQVELSSAAGSDAAVPYTAPLDIVGPPQPSAFVPVSPARVLDTRTGNGTSSGGIQPLGANSSLNVQITGVAGVPSTGVEAVAVNVTAVKPSRSTFLSVYPAYTTRPNTSSLNPAAGDTRAALVLPRLSPDGKVSVFNAAGETDVVADVVGYFPSGTSTSASLYQAASPRRLLDTRTDPTRHRLPAGTSVRVPVAGVADVPADATAAMINVTAVNPTGAGYLAASPSASAGSSTSTVNVVARQVVANRAATGLASDGSLSIYAGATASDVVVDLVGWFRPAASGGQQYTALPPARILDTRQGLGAPHAAGPGTTTRLTVAGRAGVPTDAKAVVLTLTGVRATAPGYLTAWASGARPTTSDLNLLSGTTVANLAVVPLAADGTISIYNAAGTTDLLADVLGYDR